MATKFQCDMCGGIGPPGEHTHNIHFRSIKEEHLERRDWGYRRDEPHRVIKGPDSDTYVEVCEQCNDKIRKAVNELSLSAKAPAAQADDGSKEAI